MTATFDPALADDVSVVRFQIGDTNTDSPYLQDETIEALVDSEGSINRAIIACIRYIITQLSVPNFSKDWLSVSVGEARQAYESLLAKKLVEFGLSSVVAVSSISLPTRADSDDDGEYDEE